VVGAAAIGMGVSMSLAVSGAGAVTTTHAAKLVPVKGNGEGGAIVKTADQDAKDLVGPKGTGLTRGVTSTAVKLGCLDTASAYTGYQTGIEAYLNTVNKKGGINGRKLTLTGTCKNDNGAVATNVTDNEQLVNETQVFAVLNLSGVELTGATNYLNAHQVPYDGWGFNPGFCGKRWGLSWDGDSCGNSLSTLPIEAVSGDLSRAILAAAGLNPKTVRFAVQGQTGTSGIVGDDQYDSEFKSLGAKVVYSAHNYPATASGVDNTPFVQGILATKPNVVYISTPFTDVGPLSSALRAAGYSGVILNFVDYIPGLLTESAQLAASLQGEYISAFPVPAEETGAYDKAIEADLTAIGKKPFVTLGSFIGFAEAEQLTTMIKAAGKTLNTKTFTAAVNNPNKPLASFKGAPATGPGDITYPAAHYLPSDCNAILQVTGNKYVVKAPFKCYTTFIVTKKK
jgi:branched-chain amino acid transport system substrate-binding protein